MKVTRAGRRINVVVAPDGTGLVSHAGSALLAQVADKKAREVVAERVVVEGVGDPALAVGDGPDGESLALVLHRRIGGFLGRFSAPRGYRASAARRARHGGRLITRRPISTIAGTNSPPSSSRCAGAEVLPGQLVLRPGRHDPMGSRAAAVEPPPAGRGVRSLGISRSPGSRSPGADIPGSSPVALAVYTRICRAVWRRRHPEVWLVWPPIGCPIVRARTERRG